MGGVEEDSLFFSFFKCFPNVGNLIHLFVSYRVLKCFH